MVDETEPVPAALELTFHVTELLGLLLPLTIAVNCWVLPLIIFWDDGLIEIDVTVDVLILTLTVALPDFEVSAVEVAIT